MAQIARQSLEPLAPEHATPPPTLAQMAQAVDFVEHLTAAQQVLERMMVGLRLADGVALPPVRALLQHDAAQLARLDAAVAQVVARGWGQLEGPRLVATAQGRALCDSAAVLFAL